MTLERLNALDRAAFVAAVGFAFEDAPWVADAAWSARPFASVGALWSAMMAAVNAAPPEQRLAIVRAHPDLAGRIARARGLSAAAAHEQSAAGLDALVPGEAQRLERGNAAYRERFGFPFVICAREHDAASIADALETRLQNDRERELATALNEAGKIARLRLEDVLA